MRSPLNDLKPFNKDHELTVVVETPRGSRGKYAYNPELHLFELRKFMPTGMQFPYDFGFIPGTLGEDGDPIDVIVFVDIEIPVGCILYCRPIGVIEAEQTAAKKTVRNDRIIAIPTEKRGNVLSDFQTAKELNPQLIKELNEFFVNYNRAENVEFKMLRCGGPNRAMNLIKLAAKKVHKK